MIEQGGPAKITRMFKPQPNQARAIRLRAVVSERAAGHLLEEFHEEILEARGSELRISLCFLFFVFVFLF